MKTADTASVRILAMQFAAKHVAECAKELVEWDNTGILCNGRLRELAAICRPMTLSDDEISIARSFATVAALELVAATFESKPGSRQGIKP